MRSISMYPLIFGGSTTDGHSFISSVHVNTNSSQYVGAWWIGYLIGGIMALLVAIPLCGFPKSLPGNLNLFCVFGGMMSSRTSSSVSVCVAAELSNFK